MQNEINNIVKDMFVEIEKDLNAWTIPYGEVLPGNVYALPTIKSLGPAQVIKSNDGAFKLDLPTTGSIKDIMQSPNNRETILIRRLVSKTFVSRIISNPEKVRSLLMPLVTEMILSLEKDKSFPKTTLSMGTYGRFSRPGLDANTYFASTELDPDWFELRLYSNSTSLVDIS